MFKKSLLRNISCLSFVVLSACQTNGSNVRLLDEGSTWNFQEVDGESLAIAGTSNKFGYKCVAMDDRLRACSVFLDRYSIGCKDSSGTSAPKVRYIFGDDKIIEHQSLCMNTDRGSYVWLPIGNGEKHLGLIRSIAQFNEVRINVDEYPSTSYKFGLIGASNAIEQVVHGWPDDGLTIGLSRKQWTTASAE